ncbi:MAG: dihydroorotate dehydrogenase electron transfer subunit [Candidatus Cloacimonadaceae bacterium]|nr:dihydroorotate dehydrogenase electron transfer subunit [Candidatus Cloacimonadaceae bacterium]
MKSYKILPIWRIERLKGGYFVLWIEDTELAAQCRPGQFCELKAPQGIPRLFKPISVFDVIQDRVAFFIKTVGAGTNALSVMREGDLLQVIGPLGTSFPIPNNKSIVLVSGGVGYPPLAFLKKHLPSSNQVRFLHGGACADDVFPCDECFTVDGSAGIKAFVTEGFMRLIETRHVDLVLSCGPVPMLKALSAICKANGIKHFASLEAYMACGVGVCHGCAVGVGSKGDYQRVCVEGPVFDADDLNWELM